jgi:hypothetical protein
LSTEVIVVVLFELAIFAMVGVALRISQQSNATAEKRRATAEKQRADLINLARQLVARTPAIAPPIEPEPPVARQEVHVIKARPPATTEPFYEEQHPPCTRREIPPPAPNAVVDAARRDVCGEDDDPDATLVVPSMPILAAVRPPETDAEEPIAGRTIKGGFDLLGVRPGPQ